MPESREYVDAADNSPFGKWFNGLDGQAAAKVTMAIKKVELGNTSNAKRISEGVYEIKIHFGPGYRVYFGYDGDTLIILLGGGTKQRQEVDIRKAKEC